MRSLAARQALVALLILATVAAGLALRARGPASPALPPIAALTARTPWQVVEASPPSRWGVPYRQWLLRDAAGHEALLYVGATGQVQDMLRWNGELGYLGEGYVVVGRRDARVALPGGRQAPVAQATLQHLSQLRVVQYAVAGRGGIARHGQELAPGAAWDLARGAAQGYYLVRVAVDGSRADASDVAAGLIAAVLADVAARAAAAG